MNRASVMLASLILWSGPVGADEGPMLTVTAAEASVVVTENGEQRTVGTVPEGTRLWAFETDGEYYLVLDPTSKEKAWIWNGDAEAVQYSAAEQKELTESDTAIESADEFSGKGDYVSALPLCQKSLEIRIRISGDNDPSTASAWSAVGDCQLELGDYSDAISSHSTALKIREQVLGADHPDTAISHMDLGVACHNSGEYEQAESNYLRGLAIRDDLPGDDDEYDLTCLTNIGSLYEAMEEYAKAEPYYQRALKASEALYGEDHSETASVIFRLGLVFEGLHQYSRAEPLFRRMLDINTQSFGLEHRETAEAQNALGNTLYNLGEHRKAETILKQALQTRITLLGEDNEDTARTISNLGAVSFELTDYSEAERLYQRALDITIRLVGSEHEDTAFTLDALAATYQVMGQYSRAEGLYQSGFEIRKKRFGVHHQLTASSLNSLGAVYENMGEYSKAEPMYQQSLEIYRDTIGEEHLDTALLLNNIGWLYERRGDYTQAQPMFQRALEIRTRLLGAENLETAASLIGLGTLYGDIGEYPKAELNLQRALEIHKKILGEENGTTADCLTNLGWLADLMGEPEKAEHLFRRSYEIYLKTLGAEHPNTAIAMVNLASVYEETRDFTKAIELLTQSLDVGRRVLGTHPQTADTIAYLGRVYVAMGDYSKAEELLQESLSMDRKLLDRAHPSIARDYELLSIVYAAMGDFNKATQYREDSRRIVRTHVAKTLPGLSEKSQQKYLTANFRPAFTTSLSLGLRQKDNPRAAALSAGWLLNGKGVAQEVLAESALLSSAEAAPFVRELREVRDSLSILTAQPDSDERRIQLANLESRQQELQQRVAEHGLGLYKADPWISVGTLAGRLPYGSVFVNIARFQIDTVDKIESIRVREKNLKPARYVAWVIPATGAGVIHIVDLGEAEPIDKCVASMRQHIYGAIVRLSKEGEQALEADFRDNVAELSRRILEPLEDSFKDIDEIVLSPDGELWNVPWNALLTKDGRYLVEKFRTRFVLSGRELAYNFSERAAISQPVIIADPNFSLIANREETTDADSKTDLRSTASAVFPPLAASAAEAASIRPSIENYSGASVRMLLQDEAQESAFKQLHRPRILMMSTHGYFKEAPKASTENLAERPDASQVIDNPLLRCGLALAGCNYGTSGDKTGSEDGILTGLEIVSTDLRGTELVVLSACETGIGEIHNGEGVAGLRQAFQLAGAQSVVSTLWQVPDRDSALLMSRLFKELADGRSKAEALRNAQLDRIEKRRERYGAAHPFFWAAFTLTGI
jgi:tetratricopeptide (TPR) repeat protein/CHAT domain-containing protein